MTSSVTAPTEIALRFENVHAAYGAVKALHGVSIEIPEGGVVTLLGANGAGKTTTLRTASGQLAPTDGRIWYRGEDISRKRPGQLVRRGIVHVPEGRQIIGDLTVEENLRVGGYTCKNGSEVKAGLESAYDLFPRLLERRKQRAGALSGGEQQMLAIGRGLMANPKVLLLDEPSLGLAPLVVQDIFRTLGTINRERGVTILLVEQNASVALRLASHAYVLETGRIVLHGPAKELRENDDVRKSYLGY